MQWNIFLVYSLSRIESVRHNCSPVVLFDKLPCLPTSISFNQKVSIPVDSFVRLEKTMYSG